MRTGRFLLLLVLVGAFTMTACGDDPAGVSGNPEAGEGNVYFEYTGLDGLGSFSASAEYPDPIPGDLDSSEVQAVAALEDEGELVVVMGWIPDLADSTARMVEVAFAADAGPGTYDMCTWPDYYEENCALALYVPELQLNDDSGAGPDVFYLSLSGTVVIESYVPDSHVEGRFEGEFGRIDGEGSVEGVVTNGRFSVPITDIANVR